MSLAVRTSLTCENCGDFLRNREGEVLWCSCGTWYANSAGVWRDR